MRLYVLANGIKTLWRTSLGGQAGLLHGVEPATLLGFRRIRFQGLETREFQLNPFVYFTSIL